MNDHMWEHPATQANLATLRERGVDGARARRRARWPPRASGASGRLAEPRRAARRLRGASCRAGARPLDGLRVLVTAGGTREPIDAVRYVGNRSSGRMGFALAEEAAALRRRGDGRRGQRRAAARPAACATSTSRRPPSCRRPARTSSRRCDVLLMAAAVADFRPADRGRRQDQEDRARRARRSRSSRPPTSSAASPPRRRAGADARRLRRRARRGRRGVRPRQAERKGLDAIVVNDVARPDIGFDAADNEVTIVTAGGERARRRAPPRPRSPRDPRRRSTRCAPPAPDRRRAVSEHRAERLDGPRSRPPASSVRRIADDRGPRRRGPRRRSLERPARRARSPRATSSSRTCPAWARRRSPARSRARSTSQFARVQCTADLLPADVVGTNVFNQREDRFEFRPGPDLRQRRARRRDQPRVAQDAVGPARVHAGAPRHRRRAHARARAAVRRAGHAEPGRVRGHLPAARGAGRPLHGAPVARLPDAGGRGRHARRPRGRRPRRASSSRSPTRPTLLAAQDAAARVLASDRAARATSSRCSGARATDPRVELGASPRAGLMLLRAAKARALLQGRDHALPDDVQALAPRRCSPTASCSRPRRWT